MIVRRVLEGSWRVRRIWEGPVGASKVKKGLGVFWRVFEGPEDMGGSGRVQ